MSGTSREASSAGGGAQQVEAHVRRLWRHRGVAAPAPRRGPQRRLDLDDVLDTAVQVADGAGLAGVSTRAVAAPLGLSAMGLYPYVGTKEQLLALMEDHASVLPAWDDPGTSLADDLAAWAEQLFALYRRHPWLTELSWTEAPGGPHQQDWLERLLAVLERWRTPPGSRAPVVTTLYAVVRAAAQTDAGHARAAAGDGAAAWREQAAATQRLVGDLDRRYPRAHALVQHAPHDWQDAPRASVRRVVGVLCEGLGTGGRPGRAPSGP
ncbi:TetR/AcrR family transcriptional regulator C-terminal domain-containing protein [Isoptericola cucumis]|uniref:TetR/AcrR family transcriptional regulator n=1 Tax=Isoptericola cucumis TaxID=1776856 RepID=UPI00320A586E